MKDPTTGEAIPVGKQVCPKIQFVEIAQLVVKQFYLFNSYPVAGQRRWTQPYLLHPLFRDLANGVIMMTITISNHIVKATHL